MINHLHPLLVESLEIPSMKLDLERMKGMDKELRFPSRKFESIQVAGTNGKGSVSTKIAHVLQESGKKVGLYTSPHIHTYHERIKIDGCPIPDEIADRLLNKIIEKISKQPSYFELLTLLAFLYFAEEGVECAVFETGMGGRLDATNIVSPLLSVITSIDYDHMAYLGTTLEEIAREKAGIIKSGIPLVIGPKAKPLHLFKAAAAAKKSPLIVVQEQFDHYEAENRAIARSALEQLPFFFSNEAIDKGLQATPPCRFEIISKNNPIVILDVAHNPDGLKRTFERLAFHYPNREVRVIAGFSADKAIEDSLNVIKQNAIAVHLTHTDHYRLSKVGEPIETAFEKAYTAAAEGGEILLVCGSFFIMHKARLAAKLMRERGASCGL